MTYIRTLTSLFLFLCLLTNAQVSVDGLIAHYPFDGNANDISGNLLNGQVEGATLTEDRFGNSNSAYYFDGINDYILLGNSNKLKPYPPITIAGWFFYYDLAAPFFVNDLNPTNYYGLVVNTTWNDWTSLSINNGGQIGPASRLSTHTVTQEQVWFHFASTIDENYNVKLYINGQEATTFQTGFGGELKYSNGYSYFGVLDSDTNGDPHFLHGKIDDFRFYNRVLSDDEIYELYNPSNSDDGLIARYTFDGNANDSSPNNLHGEVIGATLTPDRFGNPNSAYSFDGIDDVIDIGNDFKLKPQPPMTVACWVNYEKSLGGIFTNDFHDTRYYGIKALISSNSHIAIQYGNGGLIGPSSGRSEYIQAPQTGEWFHYAATLDDNLNAKLFINGYEVETTSYGSATTLVYANGKSVLGSYDSGQNIGPYFLKGKLDDFRFYNRILSEDEIKRLAGISTSNDSYQLSIDNVFSDNSYDIISVPVSLQIPDDQYLQAFEIDIEEFADDVEFLGLDLSNSEILGSGWEISTNNTVNGISLAGAGPGSTHYNSEILLFNLQFQLIEPYLYSKVIPLKITKAIMNDNSIPVVGNNGSITVVTDLINYGDVDLDGQVRALDASVIIQYLIGEVELTTPQYYAADVTLDSTVSGLDAQIILDFITGKVESLPFIPDSSMSLFNGNVYMQDITVNEYENIEVPVFINTDSYIYSLEGEINYNSEYLTLQNIRWPQEFNSFNAEIKDEAGSIFFAGYGETQLEKDTLFTLIFRNNSYTQSTSVSLDRIRVNEGANKTTVTSSTINITTGIEDDLDFSFALQQNYPNPFNPSTKIEFSVPKDGTVKLEIFDLLGRKVASLTDKFYPRGNYELKFNGENFNSGLYIYRITAGEYTQTKKMILLK